MQYKYSGSTEIAQIDKKHKPHGTMTLLYLPWKSLHFKHGFDARVVAEDVNEWQDMLEWKYEYQVSGTLDNQLSEVAVKRMNHMFLFKIVYNAPKMGDSPSDEELATEIGPIAFRLVFSEGEERKPIKGCMVIGSTLGNKRSVFHSCVYNMKPGKHTVQFQSRFLTPPEQIAEKDKKFIEKPAEVDENQKMPYDGDENCEGHLEIFVTGARELKEEMEEEA